jgi:hypothetical protein
MRPAKSSTQPRKAKTKRKAREKGTDLFSKNKSVPFFAPFLPIFFAFFLFFSRVK